MFNHTNATLLGLQTIRALRAEQHFKNQFYNYQNSNTAVRFLYLTTNQALTLWLEIVAVFYLSTVVFSFLAIADSNFIIKFTENLIHDTFNMYVTIYIFQMTA